MNGQRSHENATIPVFCSQLADADGSRCRRHCRFSEFDGLDSRSPIARRIEVGSNDRMKFYLLLGADPDEGHGVTSYGGNALHWAALHGEENYVKNLLAAGATVNCFEKDGFTPIVYAADRGHWEIVKMLFDAGADHRATGADGARVVDYAMTAGRDDIVQMLTNNDFSPNYWSVETFATPLKEDRDGLLSNRVWQVFPTSRVDAIDWPYRGGVRRYTAMVETDAEGNEQTIHGVTSIQILDGQNWIEVTYANGTVKRVPL